MGGGLDLADKWSKERSSLNHDILSNNYFRWALTPGRSEYADAAIKGVDLLYDDADEQAEFKITKERIDAWPEIKSKIMNLLSRTITEFDPYSSGFDVLNSYMSNENIEWLREVISNRVIFKYRLRDWTTDVENAVNKIDLEMKNIRANKSTIENLRSSVDILISIFSMKGYYHAG